MLRNVEASIHSDVALGRLALGGLLGENRVRVYADGRIARADDRTLRLASPGLESGAR